MEPMSAAAHERRRAEEKAADDAEWARHLEALRRGADDVDPTWRARCCNGAKTDCTADKFWFGCSALATMVDDHSEPLLLKRAGHERRAGWPALHPGKRCQGCGLGVHGLWLAAEPPPGTCAAERPSEDPRSCPRALEALITSRTMTRHTGKAGAWATQFMAKAGIDVAAVDAEIDQRAAIDKTRVEIFGKVQVDGQHVVTWLHEDLATRLPALIAEILINVDPTQDDKVQPPAGERFDHEDMERIEKRTATLRRRLRELVDEHVQVPEMDGDDGA